MKQNHQKCLMTIPTMKSTTKNTKTYWKEAEEPCKSNINGNWQRSQPTPNKADSPETPKAFKSITTRMQKQENFSKEAIKQKSKKQAKPMEKKWSQLQTKHIHQKPKTKWKLVCCVG